MSFTVAIDGPAAAGKGTLAKHLAAHFSMAHLDTGLLYRAVARQVLAGIDPVAAAVSLQAEDLDPTGLYTPEVAQQASRVAVLAEVRSALMAFQRNFAQRAEGAVLDGRDIGTVICCDAKVKLIFCFVFILQIYNLSTNHQTFLTIIFKLNKKLTKKGTTEVIPIMKTNKQKCAVSHYEATNIL